MSPSVAFAHQGERVVRREPTLEEIKAWPAAVSVTTAAQAFGISRSHAFDLARRGEFPAKVIRAGGRYLVVTASIISALSATNPADDAA